VHHRRVYLAGAFISRAIIGVSVRGVHPIDMPLIDIYLTGMDLTGVNPVGVYLIGACISTGHASQRRAPHKYTYLSRKPLLWACISWPRIS
jgi:hypothetical protein